MTDGIIEMDSERGRPLGFTSDRFQHMSYLWKRGNAILLSFIASVGSGQLGRLVRQIQEQGYEVHVPTPILTMPAILRHWKAKKTLVYEEDFGEMVEIWIVPRLTTGRDVVGCR